jgi:hypothetical protein
MTEVEMPYAWDTEDAVVVIYGTHEAEQARELYGAHLMQCEFTPEGDERDEQSEELSFYEGMARNWIEPRTTKSPGRWPRSSRG